MTHTGVGIRFAEDRSERMLRGQSAIPNSVSVVAIIIVISERQYRLSILLLSFPADVRLCWRGRLRERGL